MKRKCFVESLKKSIKEISFWVTLLILILLVTILIIFVPIERNKINGTVKNADIETSVQTTNS